jgi:hypothetical protein
VTPEVIAIAALVACACLVVLEQIAAAAEAVVS